MVIVVVYNITVFNFILLWSKYRSLQDSLIFHLISLVTFQNVPIPLSLLVLICKFVVRRDQFTYTNSQGLSFLRKTGLKLFPFFSFSFLLFKRQRSTVSCFFIYKPGGMIQQKICWSKFPNKLILNNFYNCHFLFNFWSLFEWKKAIMTVIFINTPVCMLFYLSYFVSQVIWNWSNLV